MGVLDGGSANVQNITTPDKPIRVLSSQCGHHLTERVTVSENWHDMTVCSLKLVPQTIHAVAAGEVRL